MSGATPRWKVRRRTCHDSTASLARKAAGAFSVSNINSPYLARLVRSLKDGSVTISGCLSGTVDSTDEKPWVNRRSK